MSKKGIIEEIFSKARFADDAKAYKIFYRDFEKLREITYKNLSKNQTIFRPYQSQE
ncbi:MAG: hypothetical protein ACREAK_07490 [Nitrosarchaeum sp.]